MPWSRRRPLCCAGQSDTRNSERTNDRTGAGRHVCTQLSGIRGTSGANCLLAEVHAPEHDGPARIRM